MNKLILFLLLFQQSEKGIGIIHKKICDKQDCFYIYRIQFKDTIVYRHINTPVIEQLPDTMPFWQYTFKNKK